jgi:hypothetical protein
MGRYEWERVVRRCVLPAPVKAVAAYLAQYANADGTKVYPGVARLSAVTCLSERSVRGALTTLRDLALITRTRKGSSLGRQAMTDEHRLTRPADLLDRVHMLDPEESPASAACDPTCNHKKSPARPAADKRPAAKEHRQVVQGTPAPHAGTPAPHDTNTGTSCTPPPNYQPIPPINQREDQLRDVSTEGQALDLDDLKAQLIQFDELQARRRGA